jgi:putative pyruvate formate lyase activating enzyme
LPRGELAERARRAVAGLAACRACPRACDVNRQADKWAACKTGRFAVVTSCFPHLGEEDCLRGWHGSGTIFFGHCNLRCVFCQNFDISQGLRPGPSVRAVAPDDLAGMMLALQHLGCHNINFVTPEHVVPQVLEGVAAAAGRGLRLPLVYNTSAYDSLESLALLDGVVDIYMPDFKFWSAERSRRYLMAADYPAAARAAIAEMHRQVGPLLLDADGLAVRGVLLRHLVMPGCLDETRAILAWIAAELGPETYVNLMDQYRPAGKVRAGRFEDISRPLAAAEYREALAIAHRVGLRRLDERASRASRRPR